MMRYGERTDAAHGGIAARPRSPSPRPGCSGRTRRGGGSRNGPTSAKERLDRNVLGGVAGRDRVPTGDAVGEYERRRAPRTRARVDRSGVRRAGRSCRHSRRRTCCARTAFLPRSGRVPDVCVLRGRCDGPAPTRCARCCRAALVGHAVRTRRSMGSATVDVTARVSRYPAH